jgi:hypothetical protein
MTTDIEKLLQQIRTLPPNQQQWLRDALNEEESHQPDGDQPQSEENFQRRLVGTGLPGESNSHP